jgi:tetratricopeptide (TPR) repeat protein
MVQRVVASVGDIYGVLAKAVWSRSRQKPSEQLTLCEAVLGSLRYQSHLADGMFQNALHTAKRAVSADPEFAWGWAILGLLNLDNFALVIDRQACNASDLALTCVQRSLRADPACGFAHWTLGLYHLTRGEVEEAVAAAQRAVELAPGSPFEMGAAGALMACAGEDGQSQSLIDCALKINPRLPGWVHWGTAMNDFSRGKHQRALTAAKRFSLPECFWDHLFHATANIRAGETERARSSIRRAHQLRPLLAERPREVVNMLVQEPNVQKDLLDILQQV